MTLLLRDHDMIEEGVEQERLRVARKMLKKGTSIDEIVEITELDQYVITKIKKELESE